MPRIKVLKEYEEEETEPSEEVQQAAQEEAPSILHEGAMWIDPPKGGGQFDDVVCSLCGAYFVEWGEYERHVRTEHFGMRGKGRKASDVCKLYRPHKEDSREG